MQQRTVCNNNFCLPTKFRTHATTTRGTKQMHSKRNTSHSLTCCGRPFLSFLVFSFHCKSFVVSGVLFLSFSIHLLMFSRMSFFGRRSRGLPSACWLLQLLQQCHGRARFQRHHNCGDSDPLFFVNCFIHLATVPVAKNCFPAHCVLLSVNRDFTLAIGSQICQVIQLLVVLPKNMLHKVINLGDRVRNLLCPPCVQGSLNSTNFHHKLLTQCVMTLVSFSRQVVVITQLHRRTLCTSVN